MPNIIRVRNLNNEKNLDGIIIPVDKTSYLANAQQVGIQDLKNYILSGYTASVTGGTSGTSGVNGIDGIDGISPCQSLYSNVIRVVIDVDVCVLECDLDCSCVMEGTVDCDYYP